MRAPMQRFSSDFPDPLAGDADRLDAALVRRARGRFARVAGALRRPPLRSRLPEGGAVIRQAATALRRLPAATRRAALLSSEMRGFLGEATLWIEVHRLAAEEAAGPRPGTPARAARRTRLFDLLSRTEHLVAVVPAGRLDAAVPARARRAALRRLREAVLDLSALVLGLRMARPGGPPASLPLAFREDPEQGRPRDRIDLGPIGGTAGPAAIHRRRGLRGAVRLRAAWSGRTLALRATGAPRRHAAARPAARATIPGTAIPLGALVRSRPRRMRVAVTPRWVGARLARALRLLEIVWPEAHALVLRRTRLVVPIDEPGTVSWSLAARPGVSFIVVPGKRVADLADDLLHESAHHLLHDLEVTADPLARGPDTGEVQAFDSPWRGTRRPLHGILHGAFTFLYRAELLRRVLRGLATRPRDLRGFLAGRGKGWLSRELRRERRRVASALSTLEAAAGEGLLTTRGRRLLRRMRRAATWSSGRRRPRGGRGSTPAPGRSRSTAGNRG